MLASGILAFHVDNLIGPERQRHLNAGPDLKILMRGANPSRPSRRNLDPIPAGPRSNPPVSDASRLLRGTMRNYEPMRHIYRATRHPYGRDALAACNSTGVGHHLQRKSEVVFG